MGILNTTPDSFSDGGNYNDPSAAVARALEMEAEGADIIDVGGESTRPGAEPVPVEIEIKRTVPVIENIRKHSNIPISIDTMKAEVARQALEAGANIINDVSAFEADEKMVEVAAQTNAGSVFMHMRGTPKTMQKDPSYANVVQEVILYLENRLNFAAQHGINRNQVVIDPGIGFGKTQEHNLALMRGLPEFSKSGCPVLVGASRKSFIGQLLGRNDPAQRLFGSLGAAAWATLHNAHILRVHDIIETCDVCRMLDTLLHGES
jgi:dihydropteroate synthase